MGGVAGAGRPDRRRSFGPSVAALVSSVTVYSFASAFALDGIPDSESGLFVVMGAVIGLRPEGVRVASVGLLWFARVAGLGVLASAVAIGVTRTRMTRARGRA